MKAITLRPATLADAEMVYEWRNAPETRKYFFDPRPLEKAAHIKWFESSLKMPDRCLLIAESENTPVGVLRFDISHSEAEIDIYVCPGLTGNGLGTAILNAGTNWINKHKPHVNTLLAKVIPANIASARAFEKSGFNLDFQVYKKKVEA